MVLIGIFGAGGHGRSMMSSAEYSVREAFCNDEAAEIAFVVEDGGASGLINGTRVLEESMFFALQADRKYFNVAIANSHLREKLSNVAIIHGAIPFQVQAQNSLISRMCEIGEGAMLSPFVTISANVRIGRFFQANLYSYVEHDCEIGDFVTFAPNVHCNGNVIVGSHAYIGTGAIIRDGTKENPLVIGEGAIVGMGAVVTRSVPAFTTVIGNPARQFGVL